MSCTGRCISAARSSRSTLNRINAASVPVRFGVGGGLVRSKQYRAPAHTSSLAWFVLCMMVPEIRTGAVPVRPCAVRGLGDAGQVGKAWAITRYRLGSGGGVELVPDQVVPKCRLRAHVVLRSSRRSWRLRAYWGKWTPCEDSGVRCAITCPTAQAGIAARRFAERGVVCLWSEQLRCAAEA